MSPAKQGSWDQHAHLHERWQPPTCCLCNCESERDALRAEVARLKAERRALVERPRIVCLCGSGRFRAEFEIAEYDETLAGRIVLTIGCNTKDVARTPYLEHYKPMLDELHLRKIDLADEVLVLNVGGYIGESTRREIDYAVAHSKPVRYLEAIAARVLAEFDKEKP